MTGTLPSRLRSNTEIGINLADVSGFDDLHAASEHMASVGEDVKQDADHQSGSDTR